MDAGETGAEGCEGDGAVGVGCYCDDEVGTGDGVDDFVGFGRGGWDLGECGFGRVLVGRHVYS